MITKVALAIAMSAAWASTAAYRGASFDKCASISDVNFQLTFKRLPVSHAAAKWRDLWSRLPTDQPGHRLSLGCSVFSIRLLACARKCRHLATIATIYS